MTSLMLLEELCLSDPVMSISGSICPDWFYTSYISFSFRSLTKFSYLKMTLQVLKILYCVSAEFISASIFHMDLGKRNVPGSNLIVRI